MLLWRTLVLYGQQLHYFHSVHAALVTRLQQEPSTKVQASIVCLLSAFLSATGTNRTKSVSFR